MSQEPKFSWKITSAFAAATALSGWLTYQSYINLPSYSAANDDATPDLNANYQASRAPQTTAQSFEKASAQSGPKPKAFENLNGDEIIATFYYDRFKNAKNADERFFTLLWSLRVMGLGFEKDALKKAGEAFGEDPVKLSKTLREAAQSYARDVPAPDRNSTKYYHAWYWNNLQIVQPYAGLQDNGVIDEELAKSTMGYTQRQLEQKRNNHITDATIETLPEVRAQLNGLGISKEALASKVDPFEEWNDNIKKLSYEEMQELVERLNVISYTVRTRNDLNPSENMSYFGMTRPEFSKMNNLIKMLENEITEYAAAYQPPPPSFPEFAREVLAPMLAPSR